MRGRQQVESVLNRRGRTLVGAGGLAGLRNSRVHRIGRPPTGLGDLQHRPHMPFTVRLDKVTTGAGFSYHPQGWHPYRATLAEYLADPDLPYHQSSLARYYDRFQPATVHETLVDQASASAAAPLDAWPPFLQLMTHIWAMTPGRVRRLLADPTRGWSKGRRQELGPQDEEFGRTQVRRLIAAHHSIATLGYRPGDYHDGELTGYLLTRGEDYRFVVMHGNHRLSSLEVLGITEVPVRFHRACPPVVQFEELHRYTGRGQVLTEEAARLVFSALFDGTGREKADRLGLVDPFVETPDLFDGLAS